MPTHERFWKQLSRSGRPFLRLLSLLVALGVACDSETALTQKCSRGDADACRSACEKGVAGEGGCFQAAQAALREAGTDTEGPEWLRASRLFRKACEGGYADGCLFASQMIESPFATVRLTKMKEPEVIVISDAAIEDRRQWLERGCKLGHAASCRRLGDVTIGKKSEVAASAYERACALGAAKQECKSARGHEVEVFETYRSACRREVADACTALGNLVHRLDFPRAVRLFLAEGQMRGVLEQAGGGRAFVERRAREARTAAVPDPTKSAPPPEPPNGVTVHLERPKIVGRLAAPFVSRGLEQQRPGLAACMADAGPGARMELTVRLIVDRTGDVWSATAQPPGPVASCVSRVLESVQLQPPVSGTAEVTQPIVVSRSPEVPDGGAPAGGDGGLRMTGQ